MAAVGMKRKSSISLQQPEPAVSGIKNINSIPHEVVTDIFARVASSSLADLLNVNQTCKFFRETGKDNWVFHHVSMDAIPMVQWRSTDQVSFFLKRCEEARNPEALYRLGMVEFFKHEGIETGRELLQKASDLGYTAATYMLGIILLDSSDEQSIKKGKDLLKKVLTKQGTNKRSRTIVKNCREKSKMVFNQIWVNNRLRRPTKRKCDNLTCRKKRKKWSRYGGDDEADAIDSCETCKFYREFNLICDMLGAH